MPVNTMDTDNKKIDVHVPRELIVLWDKLDEPWGVKDSQSCFVYANKGLHDLFNLPQGYDIEGRYDVELPTSVAEYPRN